MKTLILFSSILLGYSISFSQTESINQYDSTKKKDGKWILYLDANGDKAKDSTSAVYWRYTYYDHGTHIYPMGGFIAKNGKIESSHSKLDVKIEKLDGEYKCYESGKLKYIHIFKEGEYVSYKEFFTTGEICTYFDYTKHYEGQPRSWYMYTYNKTGKVTYEGWTKKDEKGKWPKMRG